MLLIDKGGSRVRAICRECRKLHKAKDCPLTEHRIVELLAAGGDWGERYANVAAKLGIPRRRVQNTVGRLLRLKRSLG